MNEHTAEPWHVSGIHPRNIHIGSMASPMVLASMNDIHTQTPENAARIVACVNACAGMDDPAAEILKLRENEAIVASLCASAEISIGHHALLRAENARLRAGLTLALRVAESWVHDQLDGTGSLDDALAELEPARTALRGSHE